MAFGVLRVGSHIFWKCLCRSELACDVTGTQRSKYLSGRGRAFAFIIQLMPVSHRPIDSAPRLLCIISERSITRYSVQSYRVTGNHGRLIVLQDYTTRANAALCHLLWYTANQSVE